tara:strand:+ start:4382 stop:5233 length:852 start_codon:yes stop_codon:yes gene_type:complete
MVESKIIKLGKRIDNKRFAIATNKEVNLETATGLLYDHAEKYLKWHIKWFEDYIFKYRPNYEEAIKYSKKDLIKKESNYIKNLYRDNINWHYSLEYFLRVNPIFKEDKGNLFLVDLFGKALSYSTRVLYKNESKGVIERNYHRKDDFHDFLKKELNNESKILCKNMYKFDIPKDKYDLIMSISALHHGTKKQVKALIDQIYNKIKDDGTAFIIIPSFESSKKWHTFKTSKETEPGTFVPIDGPEKGLPHSFFTKKEIEILFKNFKKLKTKTDIYGRWIIEALK